MKQTMFFLLFAAVAVMGAHFGWWKPVHALFAIVIQCGIDDICTVIRHRNVNINFTSPIRLMHIVTDKVEEEESHD